MQDIFLTVVNMNVTALYIIAAVILLRLCLKKLPKRFSYALWAIPALRLVCPFSVEAFFSLFNFLKPAKTAESQLTYIPHDIGLMEKPEISTGIPALNRVINESLPAAAPAQSVNPMQVWVLVGTVVWLVGVAAMLLWLFASYFSVAVRVRGSRQTNEGLYICDKIDAPFVFGVVKPKVYIPADLPEKELIYITAHEKAHIRRGDHIVKLIGAVILAVHWFNPGVWVAYKLMTKDMELSCDERALKGFETDVRKEYASALLAVSMKQNHLSRGGLLSFGESGIKSRIKSVLSFKKPALWVTVIAVAVLLVAGGCMLTNPVSGGEEADTDGNREGLPALDLAAFEIIEREFYGEWQRTDNPDIVIPITYSNCFLNFENSGIQSVFETENDYIFVYISGGEQGSFIKPKNEPDTIYSGSYFFSTASGKSSASEDIFHSGASYKRISKGSTELSEGELSLLGLCKLEFTLGAGFAECFNSIPSNECTAAGRTWVYVPGGSLSLPQQKIYLAGLSEYEVELGLRYINKEQSEQHFAYFDMSEAEMMKTEQITPEEMYFTVRFIKSGSKWIYEGVTGVYGADNVDVGVEDNAEYVEIEVEDETQETEAPASSESEVIARFKESDLSYDLSIFEKYFWGGYDCGWDITPMNYSNTNSLISHYFPGFAENDEIAVMQVYDGGEYNLYVMYKDDPSYIMVSGMVYGLGEENGEFNVVKTDRIIRKYDLENSAEKEPDYSLKDGQKLNSLGYMKLREITGNKDNPEAFYTQDIQDENGVDIWNYNGLTCRSFLKSLGENQVVLIREHESLTDSPWSCFFEITFKRNGDKWDYTYEKCEDPELEEYQNNPYKGIYYDAEALIYYSSLTTMPFDGIPSNFYDMIGEERFSEWLNTFDYSKLTTDIGERENLYTFIRDFDIDDETYRNHCDFLAEHGITEEQKEALLSRDKNKMAEAFVSETAHYHDGNIYTIEWYYKNPVEEYKATGITYEELKEKYRKAMDWFTFTRPARKIFEQKLEKYKEIG